MYYLQATVYENHGDYQVRAYLWSHETEGPDVLILEGDATYSPWFASVPEHVEIMSAIGALCTDIAGDSPERHAGELPLKW